MLSLVVAHLLPSPGAWWEQSSFGRPHNSGQQSRCHSIERWARETWQTPIDNGWWHAQWSTPNPSGQGKLWRLAKTYLWTKWESQTKGCDTWEKWGIRRVHLSKYQQVERLCSDNDDYQTKIPLLFRSVISSMLNIRILSQNSFMGPLITDWKRLKSSFSVLLPHEV